jgi:hypothetical protein
MFSSPNEIKKSILNFQMGFSLTDVQGFFQFCVLVEDHFWFSPKGHKLWSAASTVGVAKL